MISLLAALDQLAWPVLRAGSLQDAARLCHAQSFELLLVDVASPPLSREARGDLNADTPCLPVTRTPRSQHPEAILCYDDGLGAAAIAAYVAGELDRIADQRMLGTAAQLVAAPSRLSAVPIPPALEAARRLEWMYAHAPSLDDAAAVVERQEHLAKHVIRLAHAAFGDDMRSWQLGRVLLHVGLMRFIPLVKIVAARSMFPVRDPGRRQTIDAIWRFSLGRAVAMRCLAPRLEAGADLAFDAGLYADAGAGLMLWLRDQGEPRRPRPWPGASLTAQQAAQHEWLGEKLLERWKQRRSIAEVARGHHLALREGLSPLSVLAAPAGAITEAAGLGLDPTGPSGGRPVGEIFDHLRITPADFTCITSLVKLEVERIDEAFVV
jgi:HD-like signal output (HDOD) protein